MTRTSSQAGRANVWSKAGAREKASGVVRLELLRSSGIAFRVAKVELAADSPGGRRRSQEMRWRKTVESCVSDDVLGVLGVVEERGGVEGCSEEGSMNAAHRGKLFQRCMEDRMGEEHARHVVVERCWSA